MNYLFRPSSIGRIMTEPKTKSEGPLSVGARTYIRELVAQEIFGVQFDVSSKYMEKGLRCEQDSIDLLNKVRGLSLVKNTERRNDEYLTGECDLFDVANRRGHDLKTSWSLQTFPISIEGCYDKMYEWQMVAYQRLWDADEWEVNYAMVSTPEDLMRYEPMPLHIVSHIPPEHRITSWVITRDMEKEAAMIEKIKAARVYFSEVVAEFDRTHAIVQDIFHANDAAILTEFAERFPLINAKADEDESSAIDEEPVTLKLGDINARLTPISVSAQALADLGINHVATDKAAKLYRESQFKQICDAIIYSVKNAQFAAAMMRKSV